MAQEIPRGVLELEDIRRRQRMGGSMYTFGGGTIGGEVWDWKPPTTTQMAFGKYEAGQMVPTLKEQYAGKVNVIPAGMGNRQEYSWMKQQGMPYIEAPEKLTYKTEQESGFRGGSGFYNPRSEKFSGTVMGMGEYGGHGSGIGSQSPNLTQRNWKNYVGTNPMRGRIGTNFYEGNPIRGSGEVGGGIPKTTKNPDYIQKSGFKNPSPSPLFGSQQLGGLTGFGGYPMFPFANY